MKLPFLLYPPIILPCDFNVIGWMGTLIFIATLIAIQKGAWKQKWTIQKAHILTSKMAFQAFQSFIVY